MAGETDQTLHAADEPTINETNNTSRAESNVPVASASSNAAVEKMVNKTIPSMSDC
jgi:hypothetical protein